MVFDHSIEISGLEMGETYHYRVISCTSIGDSAVSEDLELTVFEPLVNNITTNSAMINWSTNDATDSYIEYGLSADSKNENLIDNDYVTNHRLLDNNRITYISPDQSFQTFNPGSPSTNNAPSAVIEVDGKTITDDQITVDKDESVQFVGSNSTDPDGDDLTFCWTFGDGNISHENNPTHTYQSGGTFEVTLTVDDEKWPEYDTNPFVITTPQPHITRRGGIIVSDLDGDGLLDYILTTKDDPFTSESARATIGAYAHDGSILWVEDVDLHINGNAENYGLPGWHGPGITTADIDGDSQVEILHLDSQNRVVVRTGNTGVIERTITVSHSLSGADIWGHLQVVNLRGKGDFDLILQANPENFGSQQNMFKWLKAIALDSEETLWEVDNYWGPRHGGFRAADIDGDGRDEVIGAVIIDHNGNRMNGWDYRTIQGHIDALHTADIKPDIPGLEIMVMEESWGVTDDRTAVFNPDQVFFYALRNGDEPQNGAIGDFDLSRQGLEIWNRSRFNYDQRPWVISSDGEVIAEWIMNDKKPYDWTTEGIETIYTIDWDGGDKQYIAAKERHIEGNIAIIDAMTGYFVRWWEDQSARIFVADVAGDYREEIIVVNGAAGEIHIYWNDAENPHPLKSRYWNYNLYRRQKENYNYYSP
jgi:PKD repeat protein